VLEPIKISSVRKALQSKSAVIFFRYGYVRKNAIKAFLSACKDCRVEAYIETDKDYYKDLTEKAKKAVLGKISIDTSNAKKFKLEQCAKNLKVVSQLAFSYKSEYSKGARVFYLFATDDVPLAEGT